MQTETTKPRPLNDFISEIKKDGLARSNRFNVVIGKPTGMNGNANAALRLLTLYCDQTSLPGISFGSQPVRTFGENREVAYERNFEQISLTFYVDRNLEVVSFFENWANLIVDPTTRSMGYYNNYISSINIYVQDVSEKTVHQITLEEAYPKTISPITLDYGSKDVMKLQVSFAYKYHKGIPVSNGTGEIDTRTMYNIATQDVQGFAQDYAAINGLIGNSTIPEMYYSNFNQYQQQLNDSFSVRSALSSLERQGITTGLGGYLL